MSGPGVVGGHVGPPRDRDELLARVGERKSRIYAMVRTVLDDLEAVAPWEGLYYPPTDSGEFLSMENALVAMIEDIPDRVGTLTRVLQAGDMDEATRELVDNAEFYFHGIGVSVASELEKLRTKLEGFNTGSHSLSTIERAFTCEISGDLKGKYTSSIMGAAASLIAEGLWNGIEIEPILFPEKAEEFERNERLVARLSRVTETIQNFLEQVPLVELVASWRLNQRVDQYALAPLYSLLGDLGKLMQFSSRRALYSGDYHQIQKREVLLSARINELTSLHSMTWRTSAEAERTGDEVYAAMIERAVELAAILDLEILKKIIGDSSVKDLFFIVTAEKEDADAGRSDLEERRLSRRNRIPEELHSLIPLLGDEDLKTFLELLLGSVLKRASLTVQRQSPEPLPVPEPSPVPEPLPVPVPEAVPSTVPETAGSPMPGLQAVDLESPESLANASPEVDQRSLAEESLMADVTLLPPPALFDLEAPAGLQAGMRPDGVPPADDAFPPPADAFLPAVGEPAPSEHAPPEITPAEGVWPPPDEVFPPQDQWSRSAIDPNLDRLEALARLLEVLQPLLSSGSSNRKSFELVRRLLNQKRAIPSGLLQSMRPYLYDIMNQLVPKLRDDHRLGDAYADYGASLLGHCQVLCDPNLSPESGLTDVPVVMEQVLDLLGRLAIAARSSVERGMA